MRFPNPRLTVASPEPPPMGDRTNPRTVAGHFSGHPNVMATRSDLLPIVGTQLVFLDTPSASSFGAHLLALQLAVALINLTPMHLIGKFHPSELDVDLRA